MEEERTLLVGMDLGEEYTQMNCFDFTTYEPMPIGRSADGERVYEIRTALSINPVKGEWNWVEDGQEAQEDAIQLNYLLADVMREDTITVGKYSFRSEEVLKRFVVKVLSLLSEYYPSERIRRLVITVPQKNEKLVQYLEGILQEIGLPKKCFAIQNYRQSYMYYAISQPKELWNNNVGLFEFNSNSLLYSQIDVDRKTMPYIVGVVQKDLSDGIDWEQLAEDGENRLSYAFLNAANTALYKQLVTTVYVTGKEFEKPWAAEALKDLCVGRRVFRGQNLYTKGACYAARELSGEGKLSHCLFLDEEMVACNVSIRVYKDAQIQDIIMVNAGTTWKEVDESIDVIPDEEDEIQIIIQDILKHETKAHLLSLSGFSGRKNKMTRFTIRIRFADSENCIVTLKDNGFGDFCPSSNRVWERYISVK